MLRSPLVGVCVVSLFRIRVSFLDHLCGTLSHPIFALRVIKSVSIVLTSKSLWLLRAPPSSLYSYCMGFCPAWRRLNSPFETPKLDPMLMVIQALKSLTLGVAPECLVLLYLADVSLSCPTFRVPKAGA